MIEVVFNYNIGLYSATSVCLNSTVNSHLIFPTLTVLNASINNTEMLKFISFDYASKDIIFDMSNHTVWP